MEEGRRAAEGMIAFGGGGGYTIHEARAGWRLGVGGVGF